MPALLKPTRKDLIELAFVEARKAKLKELLEAQQQERVLKEQRLTLTQEASTQVLTASKKYHKKVVAALKTLESLGFNTQFSLCHDHDEPVGVTCYASANLGLPPDLDLGDYRSQLSESTRLLVEHHQKVVLLHQAERELTQERVKTELLQANLPARATELLAELGALMKQAYEEQR